MNKSSHFNRLSNVISITVIFVVLFLIVDYSLGETFTCEGHVATHTFVRQTEVHFRPAPKPNVWIPVDDSTIYGLVLTYQHQASIMPVPTEYAYEVKNGDVIPLKVKTGFITGHIYNTRIEYPIWENWKKK